MEQNLENTWDKKTPEWKIVEKVEAIPAHEVFNPAYYEGADYWNQQESIAEAEEPITLENAIGDMEIKYTPFDAKKALKSIRYFSPEERKLAPAEKRKIRQERLTAIKHNLEFQKQGTARLIRELRDMVQKNLEVSHEELFSRVKEFAPAYGFTENQLGCFNYAIALYRDRHESVGKYRALYLDDSDLFEACFGKKPKGTVSVVQGPMTLHFRCFHPYDFAAAYYFGKEGWSGEITENELNRTNLVGGNAKQGVKIDELLLAVTIENASKHITGFEIVPEEREAEIRDQEIELYVSEAMGDITIAADEKTVWQLKVVERDSLKMASRFQLVRPDAPESPIFDVRVIDAPEEIRKKLFIHKLFEDVQHPEAKKNLGNKGELLRIGEEHYGHLLLHPYGFLTLTPLGKGIKMRYQQEAAIPVVDEKASEATRIHEEQHQFNTLFVPLEMRQGYLELLQEVAKTAQKSPRDAVEKLIHGLVRFERRSVIGLDMDNSARDEILAYYKDGTSAKDIYSTLTQAPNYDYVKKRHDKISRIPQDIAKEARKKLSIVFYEVDAAPLAVDPNEVVPYLDRVFRDEYRQDLKRWVDSIPLLEQKGYNREEIISFLYQEPAWRWPAFSRRIKPKSANV